MVDKLCDYIIQSMKKEMPDIDKEREEVIKYGMQLIIGEIPKIILLFAVAFVLGIGWLTVFAFIAILPYKSATGGFHLKSHVGCIVGTFAFYCGAVWLSQNIVFNPEYVKYFVIGAIWIFGACMVSKYAPADTINLPILSSKERKNKKVLSYVMLTATLIVAGVVRDNVLSNILLVEVFLQTLTITRVAYYLTKNEYGYETYMKESANQAQ